MRKQHGFTLIELLIVLSILGILVSIVAMSVGEITETAKVRGAASEQAIVQTAIDTYNTQNVPVAIEPTIVARSTAARIYLTDTNASGQVPFKQYLNSDSKYWYAWDEGGQGITISLTAP